MATQAAFNQLLAQTYPNAPIAEERYDEDEQVNAALAAEIAERVHDFETQLHRPLQPHEHDEIATKVTEQFDQAVEHADRVLTNFSADFAHQVPLLERDLGRRLLQPELDGIHQQAWHRLQTRGEPLDAEAAWSEYWRHHNTQTGAEPPDLDNRHDVDKHMADRVREQRREAEAHDDQRRETEWVAPDIEWADGNSGNAHTENAQRQVARMYELSGREVPRDLQRYASQPPPEDDEE